MNMEEDEGSFEKINYLLRLKKQIERKMMIDLIKKFSEALPISDYRYVGFGSPYFADFIMFHKYLNINKMTSLEYLQKKKMRFEFNKPYKFVKLVMKSAEDFMNNDIDWDEHKIMWLDYDYMMDNSVIADITTFSARARHEDFLFVTVEAEPHKDEKDTEEFLEAFAGYVGDMSLLEARENFPLVASRIVSSSVNEGLRDNPVLTQVKQLLNVTYADTKTMYTYGAIFLPKESNVVEESGLESLEFVTDGDNVYSIDCPLLTPKEKYHLDAYIDDRGVCVASKRPTGLSAKQRMSYAKFYKYYPQFFESVY